jgi:hypothetical protein
MLRIFDTMVEAMRMGGSDADAAAGDRVDRGARS